MMTKIDQINLQRKEQYKSFIKGEMKQAESHRQMKQSKEWERKEKLRVMKKYEDAFHSNEALRKKRNVQKMKAQTHRDLNL